MGETLVAYPSHQAFALPFYQDKQLGRPTPSGIIRNHHQPLLAYGNGYNTPNVDALLRNLQIEIKGAKFDDLKITFENVLLCFCFKGLEHQRHLLLPSAESMSIDVN